MSRIWLSFLAVAALSWGARAQKVVVSEPAGGQIIHIQTALNHLTVLEMNEPVSTVAVGSPVFKVEWRGNKVFIEPTEPDVETNLFVWTASGRFNYELDPAGTVPKMDFAIEQPFAAPPVARVPGRRPSKRGDPSPAEILMEAKPIRLHGSFSQKDRVTVDLTDLLEHDGQLLIRYTIRNESKKVYSPGTSRILKLRAPWYRESLYTLERYQLGCGQVPGLKSSGEIPIEVAKTEIRSPRLEPGEETAGITAIKLPPAHAEPTVLQLIFLRGPKGPVSATLVL